MEWGRGGEPENGREKEVGAKGRWVGGREGEPQDGRANEVTQQGRWTTAHV